MQCIDEAQFNLKQLHRLQHFQLPISRGLAFNQLSLSRERSSSGEPAPPGDDPEPEPIVGVKDEEQEEKAGEEVVPELTEEDQLVAQVKEKALELLESWSLLKEVFKIPKKERQAERIKHERAADLGWPPTEERILLPPTNPGDLHE